MKKSLMYVTAAAMLAMPLMTFAVTDDDQSVNAVPTLISASEDKPVGPDGTCASPKKLVCHVMSAEQNKSATLCVSESSLASHLSHGDKEGACEGATQKPGADLTKIPGPWALGSFDEIRQIGNALWGKMKPKADGEGREKIPGPWAISSFEDIQKVGNALWGKPRKGVLLGRFSLAGLACLGDALDKRETAVIAAMDVKHAADRAALVARKDCHKAALNAGSFTDVVKKLRACSETYVTAKRAAAKTYGDAMTAANKTFMEEAKACLKNNTSTDAAAPEASQVLGATEEPKLDDQKSPPGQGGDGEKPKGGVGNDFQPSGQNGR